MSGLPALLCLRLLWWLSLSWGWTVIWGLLLKETSAIIKNFLNYVPEKTTIRVT